MNEQTKMKPTPPFREESNTAACGSHLPIPFVWQKRQQGFVAECYLPFDGGNVELKPSPLHWLMTPLRHGQMEISAQVGRSKMQLNGLLCPRTVYFIPAYMGSQWKMKNTLGCFHLGFSDEVLMDALARQGISKARISDVFPVLAQKAPSLANHLQDLANVGVTSKGLLATVDALVSYSFGQNNMQKSERGLPQDVFKVISNMVHARFHETISLADLSICAQMNSFVLSRKFRLAVGRNLHEYINWVRVCYVRELLCIKPSQRLPMIEMAYQCGFSDQSHMSRVFKKMMGYTPSDYLDQVEFKELYQPVAESVLV